MSNSLAARKTLRMPWRENIPSYLKGDGLTRIAGKLGRTLVVPLVGIGIFLALWAAVAGQIQTSLGQLPGPAHVWGQGKALLEEHRAERGREVAFYERLEKRADKALAAGKPQQAIDRIKGRAYTGAPTFIDQVWTSLITVVTGFVLASLIAIPVGILCGMSATVYSALNPFSGVCT